jgi:Na+-translocating ferredoxin:NAD+ oxidoreductase RnfC subunit
LFLPDPIQDNGVVGAGGGGFPAAVKLRAKAEIVIVNGAECEPLLHKDKELLLHQAAAMLSGLRLAVERVGARQAVIGIKGKYEAVIKAITGQLPAGVRVHPLTDTYPAGDEFLLVYDVTGRVVPPGGLPLDVGAVVLNVETLVNIGLNRPVTHKYLTVAGAVAEPVTLRVPVGTPLSEVIQAAGGATVPEYDVLMGGTMMGSLASGPGEPIVKTTGGAVVLPRGHGLIQRYKLSWSGIYRIGKSACDQCTFCTELCPRRLLGHPIEPHLAMRALGFAPAKDQMIAGTLYCCECNLCSLFACPESLDPKNVCVHDKAIAREKKLKWSGEPAEVRPHSLFAARRIPIRRLMQRLGLTGFRNVGPLEDRPLKPRRVVLPLKQHAGVPAEAKVRPGDRVREGDLIAAPPQGQLGANIHASIGGTVREVNGAITIER